MKFVILSTVLLFGALPCVAFTLGPRAHASAVLKCSPPETNFLPELSIIDELVLSILSAIPRAMAPPAPMDDSRLVKDPPSYFTPMSAAGWAKKSHSSAKKGFHDLELAQKFSLKYR